MHSQTSFTWIGIGKQGRKREKNFRYRERRAPLILQDIQADTSVCVDVRMINARGELELGRLSKESDK